MEVVDSSPMTGKAAFIGFGEVNSPQDYLMERAEKAKATVQAAGVHIVREAFVVDDEAKVYEKNAVKQLELGGFDMVIVCVVGWIPTHSIINTIQCVKHLPMLVWGLGGHMEGKKMVTAAAQAGTTALRYPMERLGYNFQFIFDYPGMPTDVSRIEAFAKAASAKSRMGSCRIGQIGYRDMRLYGTMFDGLLLKRILGTEMEFAELLEMQQREMQVPEAKIEAVKAQIKKDWAFQREPKDETLERGIKSFLAIKEMIEEKGWEGISIKDVDGMKKLLNNPPSLVFMLLAGYLEVPTIPLNDSLGLVTQMICKYLTGQISFYMEFFDFYPDSILMGVPDYIPPQAARDVFEVTPSKFGLLGECILGNARVKDGDVTICRLFEDGEGYTMHIVPCDARQPRPWEEIGWDPPAPRLASLEMVPRNGTVEDFAQKVMGKMYIVTFGNNTPLLELFCRLCGIKIMY